MKKTLFVFLLIILTFSSCEQVIDIDLNLADPALVIEGEIVQDSLAKVCLKETTSYFSPETQCHIGNALVLVQEDDNVPDTLINLGSGQYQSSTLRGKIGSNYTMTVVYDEIVYEAESNIPDAPLIYKIGSSPLSNMSFPREGMPDTNTTPFMLAAMLYNDLSIDNYFLTQFLINGEIVSSPFDLISDQNSQNDTLTVMAMYNCKKGDTLVVRAYAADQYVYRYFEMLDDILSLNMMESSSPFNPWSNISNDALGIFSAMSLSSDTVIVGDMK